MWFGLEIDVVGLPPLLELRMPGGLDNPPLLNVYSLLKVIHGINV